MIDRAFDLDDDDRPRSCCLQLRCKTMWARADERPGRLHASDYIDYWCARTGVDEGPDGHVTLHGRCQPGRACFEGEDLA